MSPSLLRDDLFGITDVVLCQSFEIEIHEVVFGSMARRVPITLGSSEVSRISARFSIPPFSVICAIFWLMNMDTAIRSFSYELKNEKIVCFGFSGKNRLRPMK